MNQVDQWVCAEFERLAQVICDFDPYLQLEMVPVAEWGSLIDKSKVFRIVDDRTNKVVLYADSLANPVSILERLWSMDSTKGSVVNRLDAHNAAVQALKMQEYLETREEMQDFSTFVFKNEKSRWKHKGVIRDAEFRDLGSGVSHIV